MKKQIIKSALTVLFIGLINHSGFAQQLSELMAFGGPNGIYINTGIEIGSLEVPSNNVTGYKIERQVVGDKNWQFVVNLSAPKNYDEFLNRIYSTNLLLVDSIPAKELPLKVIWDKTQKYKRIDSLKYLGNPLVVRIAFGVCYLDKDVEQKEEYRYKVSKLDVSGKENESFYSNVVSFPPKISEGKIVFVNKETSEKSIQLMWENVDARFARIKVFRQSNFISGYSEISTEKYYSSNKEKNIINIIDTLVQPNDVYQYFLIPVDYYQNYGSSTDTITVAAFSFNSIIPPYNIKVTGLDSLGALKLDWKLDQANKILSTKIYRSKYSNSGFVEIAELHSTTTSFIDRTAEPMTKYFYYLELNDQFGEVPYKTAKVFGLYKSNAIPMTPMNLHSTKTEKGVKLIWEQPEQAINVYHVYRNFDESLSLHELTSIVSNDSIVQFVDTSSSLKSNKYFYYAVRSENASNILSDFSDTISVVSVSNQKLNPPKDLKGYADEAGVVLYWQNMFAEDPTISGYQVFRKFASNNSKAEFKPVIDSLLSPKQNNFVDVSAKEYGEYEYAVKVYDIFGKESDLSTSISINILSEPVLVPSGISAISIDEGIKISWQISSLNKIKEFVLYRYMRGEEPKNIATIASNKPLEFIDTNTKNDNLYFYFLKSVSELNIESDPSQEVGIRK
jgi:fibronectin type 3 domain-containing protein